MSNDVSKEGWVKLRENYLNERRIKGEQKVGQKFNRNSTEIQQVCFYNKVRELSGNCQRLNRYAESIPEVYQNKRRTKGEQKTGYKSQLIGKKASKKGFTI